MSDATRLMRGHPRHLVNSALRAAWQGRWAGAQTVDATWPELLVACYGWQTAGPLRTADKVPTPNLYLFQHVPRRDRAAARAALSRAVARLEGQGVLARLGPGVRLTDAGWQRASLAVTGRIVPLPVATGTAMMLHPWASRNLDEVFARQEMAVRFLEGSVRAVHSGPCTAREMLDVVTRFCRALDVGDVAECPPEAGWFLAERLRALADRLDARDA